MNGVTEVCASICETRFEEQEKAFTIDRSWQGNPAQRNGCAADDLPNTPGALLGRD